MRYTANARRHYQMTWGNFPTLRLTVVEWTDIMSSWSDLRSYGRRLVPCNLINRHHPFGPGEGGGAVCASIFGQKSECETRVAPKRWKMCAEGASRCLILTRQRDLVVHVLCCRVWPGGMVYRHTGRGALRYCSVLFSDAVSFGRVRKIAKNNC
jgi:hypothetical protein